MAPGYHTYQDEMIKTGHGFPVWYGDPYAGQDIQIGDVGYMKEGAFRCIRRPSQPEYNASEVELRPIDFPTPLLSGSLKERGFRGDLETSTLPVNAVETRDADFFSCSDGDKDAMGQEFLKNAQSWRDDAAQARIVPVDFPLGRLILVTGFYKTWNWAAMAMSSDSSNGNLDFSVKATGLGGGGLSYDWNDVQLVSPARSSGHRHPPGLAVPPATATPTSEIFANSCRDHSDVRNQCIFLRGFRYRERELLKDKLKVLDPVDWIPSLLGNIFRRTSNFTSTPISAIPAVPPKAPSSDSQQQQSFSAHVEPIDGLPGPGASDALYDAVALEKFMQEKNLSTVVVHDNELIALLERYQSVEQLRRRTSIQTSELLVKEDLLEPRAPFRESEDNYDSSHEPNSSSGPNEASSYEKVKTIQVGEGRSDESGPELSLHATSPDTFGEGSQDKLPRQGDVEKDELVVPDNPRLRTDSEASGALSRSLFTENSLGSSHIPSVSDRQKSREIYYKAMIVMGYGIPLTIPGPSKHLPLKYRRSGISIGDVGIMTPFGGFDFLFNICLPSDHPVNRGILSERFIPFEIARFEIRRGASFKNNSYLTSPSMKFIPHYDHASTLTFESEEHQGAVLAMPFGSNTEDLDRFAMARIQGYTTVNAESWYIYARNIGRDIKNGDLSLVVGHDKTTAWGMATFSTLKSAEKDPVRLTFKQVARNDIRRSYVWESSSSMVEVRTGPDAKEEEELQMGDAAEEGTDYENQCLFVRTLQINMRDIGNLWKNPRPTGMGILPSSSPEILATSMVH